MKTLGLSPSQPSTNIAAWSTCYLLLVLRFAAGCELSTKAITFFDSALPLSHRQLCVVSSLLRTRRDYGNLFAAPNVLLGFIINSPVFNVACSLRLSCLIMQNNEGAFL